MLTAEPVNWFGSGLVWFPFGLVLVWFGSGLVWFGLVAWFCFVWFGSGLVVAGTEIPRRWWKREIIYLSLHCHHQNGSCTKTGSDERHFNVSLNVRDKVTRRYPQITIFEERRIEPRSFCQPNQPNRTSLTSCC